MHRNTSVKIFSVHVHRRDLAVGICGVVINSTACITAGGVDRDLIFSIGYLAAASLLVDRSSDMEKLCHTLLLGIVRNCVHFCKRDSRKTGS